MYLLEKEVKQEKPHGGLCGLCGAATMVDENGTPYIICQPCHNRMIRVSSTYRTQLDKLPFGVIDLDAQATVLAYNRKESELSRLSPEKVIGRNFFTEIAPCTAVKEFQGRFNEFMQGHEQVMTFDFIFSFRDGPVEVEIFFLRGSSINGFSTDGHFARIVVKRVGK